MPSPTYEDADVLRALDAFDQTGAGLRSDRAGSEDTGLTDASLNDLSGAPSTPSPIEPEQLEPSHGAPPDLSKERNALMVPGAENTPTHLLPGSVTNVPVTSSPGAPAPKLTPEAQADADVNAAQARAATSEGQAGQAENAAKAATLEARAKAAEGAAGEAAKADQAYHLARAATEKQADAETATWMADLDRKAAEEPNPGRWWENTSGFGKGLWLLGLAFGAAAVARGGNPAAQNVALRMLDEEINADIGRQKDRIGREIDSLKSRGAQLERKHARDLSDAGDDHASKIARLNTLAQAADMRAQAPGTPDDAAVWAQAKQHLDKLKADTAWAKREQLAQEKSKQLDRDAAMARVRTEQGGALQRSEIESATRIAVANIEAGAKVATAGAGKAGEYLPLPTQITGTPGEGGMYVKTSAGERIPLAIHKGSVDKATPIVQAYQKEAVGTSNLIDALKGESALGAAAWNDPNVRAALARLADPQVKEYGGRLTAPTADLMKEMALGEDPSKVWDRIKGPSRDEVIKILEQRGRNIPKEAAAAMSAFPSNLAEDTGAQLIFEPGETRGKAPAPPTGTETYKTVTGEAQKSVPLSDFPTGREIEEYGPQVVSALPPDLRKSVTEALDNFKSGVDAAAIDKAETRALKAIGDADLPAKQRQDASAVLARDASKAKREATEALEATKSILSISRHRPTAGDVKEVLEKEGLHATADDPARLKALADEVGAEFDRRQGF